MRRVYTDVAAFRAPFRSPNISFAGLGVLGSDHKAYDANKWPRGRTYWNTNFYRAPYQQGYYQSGALRGFSLDAMTGTQKLAVAAAAVGLAYVYRNKIKKLVARS